jgi:hypothetical protein
LCLLPLAQFIIDILKVGKGSTQLQTDNSLVVDHDPRYHVAQQFFLIAALQCIIVVTPVDWTQG